MIFRGLAALLAAFLAGCQSPGPITAEDSMLSLALAEGEWPSITRELVEVDEAHEELWDWPSGALRTVRTRRQSYLPYDFNDPEDLVENISRWPTFVRTEVDLESVRTGRNAMGAFLYATAVKRDRLCFYMLQAIPPFQPPNTAPVNTSEISDGYVSMYQCALASTTTLAALETRGLEFATALDRRW